MCISRSLCFDAQYHSAAASFLWELSLYLYLERNHWCSMKWKSLFELTMERFSTICKVQKRLWVVFEYVCLCFILIMVESVYEYAVKVLLQLVLLSQFPIPLPGPELFRQFRNFILANSVCLVTVIPMGCLTSGII